MLPPRSGRVSGLLIVSLLANLGVVGWLGYAAIDGRLPGASATTPSGDRPAGLPADDRDGIGALGRVQPAGGVIGLFGLPGDRVVELKVAVGSVVQPGQELATLAGDGERRAAVDALAGQVAEADALRSALTVSRDARLEDADYEFAAADAKLEAEQAGLDAKAAVLAVQEKRAVTELTRLQRAKAGGLPVAEQEMLVAETAVAQVAEERKAVTAQRGLLGNQRTKGESSLKAKKKLVAAEADRTLAQVPTNSLLASKRAAEQKLDDARLVARRPGRVVKVLARPGDTLSAAPVLQMADTSALVVLAEVYESDVPRLRGWLATGKAVAAEIDGRVLGDAGPPLAGTVTADGVAPMIARNQVFALGPREDADRRVVEVEVELAPESVGVAQNFIGLQVRTRFLPPQ